MGTGQVVIGSPTIGQKLASSTAQKYTNTLSGTHRGYVGVIQSSGFSGVRTEISRLLKEKRYDALLKTLAKWTSRTLATPWQKVLEPREMAHVLGKLVSYQKDILFKFGTVQMMGQGGKLSPNEARAHVREVREQIRAVYANLLGGNAGKKGLHLYSKEAGYLERPLTSNTSTYTMSAADYENMVSLELNNAKLDLASRWFRRMELQYGSQVYKHMTPRLWALRFRVFGNAQPSLWRVERSAFSDSIVDPRQSRLKHQRKWLDLFNEYTAQQTVALAQKLRVTFYNSLVGVMLASISYGQNVDQAMRLIEVNWGLLPQGKLVSGFEKPTPLDPLFPTTDVLGTVAVAMLFNRKFVAAMAYINGFQVHYGLELDTSARRFWDQVFRWADIATRYSEARAFQYFVSESGTAPNSTSKFGLASDDFPAALAEAQKSADFDYEGFLEFVAGVRRQRVGLVSELWRCFHEASPGFSPRACQTYLQLAEEYLQPSVVLLVFERQQLGAQICYDLLHYLSLQNAAYSVSSDSYNARVSMATVAKIRHLYTKTMQVLINLKGNAGHMGEIPHVTRKWSLDADMRNDIDRWAQLHEQQYLEQMHVLEAQRLAEDEDAGFLDLM